VKSTGCFSLGLEKHFSFSKQIASVVHRIKNELYKNYKHPITKPQTKQHRHQALFTYLVSSKLHFLHPMPTQPSPVTTKCILLVDGASNVMGSIAGIILEGRDSSLLEESL